MHDFDKSEMPIETTVIKEVVATESGYYGEFMVATHKAYALGMAWYKGRLPHGEWVWFKSSELEDVK